MTMYTSDRRLWITNDGKLVEEGDPRAALLLVGEGGQLSDEDAERYGLTGTKAKAAPPANKARQRPTEDK
jgi:hypothetical protein